MPSSNPSDPNASRPDRGGLLNSWKEIATYLNRSIVTVRRWEKKEALPVHRDKKAKSVTIRAYQSELDQWSRAREKEEQAEAGGAPRVPLEAAPATELDAALEAESGLETALAEPPDPEPAAEAEPDAPAEMPSSGRQPSVGADGPSLSDAPAGERLASWKKIAAYLDKGVGKVKGLAKQKGLPVHRNAKTKRAAIWAYTSELDAWLRQTESAPPTEAIAEPEIQDQPLPLADRASQPIAETETLPAAEASAEPERQPASEPEPQPPAESEILSEVEVAPEIVPEFFSETEGPAAAASPDPPGPASVSEVEAPAEQRPAEPEIPEPEPAAEPAHEMEPAEAEEAAAAPEPFVPAPGPPPSEDLLNSWREIAAYFDCSVGTVRRWEKSKGLPVHRDRRQNLVWIYAYRWELEHWGQAGAGVASGEVPGPLAPPSAPGRFETAPEQATAAPPLGLPTAEVELPPVDDTTYATVSVAKSSEADSAGEMPPLVLAQAGLTVFGGMLLVIYLIGTVVNGKVLAQVLSAGVLMIFPLAIAPIVIGALIIRRSEKSGHRPPGFVWAQAGMYVGLTLAVITTLIVAFAAAVEMMQLIAALPIPQMPRFL